MKSCDEDKREIKVEAYPLIKTSIRSKNSRGSLRGPGISSDWAYIAVIYTAKQWVSDKQQQQVGYVIAERGILVIGVVLAEQRSQRLT